ncbi:PD40 domain-containing protein [Nostocaceae cyanobacterium CENA369]|uniref:PD40 domain-containing protein n=1 Tax=Dendronalium phyllosphericum CENA369 TaxID=1725256 RepID=A0A8J7LGZ6_9NOST|nr:PD40 domain-containing protein [Dendronalium phyllosphericum]MBH8573444.1 PD40 domain-containing protein [Dendronalium phyllosphericum CENA369]
MNKQHQRKDASVDNKQSLQTLVRAIRLSQGQFSLILLRCNYGSLQKYIMQQLQELFPITIREIHLPASVKTLYTSILTELRDEQPNALMVFGLDAVEELDTVLTAANQVREEFSKQLPFPLLLWVNDQVLQKFIRLATDLENWATIIEFVLVTDELISFLQQKTDEIFADDANLNPQICRELETAHKDLQRCGTVLDPALQASLEFVLGLKEYLHDRIEPALEYYQSSLSFWQENHYLERQGILLLHIALAYYRKAEQNWLENRCYWEKSRHYLQQSIDIFNQARRLDLVARYISKLGEVLRFLKAWDELYNLTQNALKLHQNFVNPLQIAQDYGFLAEVMLQRSHYLEANQLAQKALTILSHTPNLQPYEWGLYRLILAKSEQGLGQVSQAILNLKIAREESNPQYNPQLYISILEKLRSLYFQQGEYQKAFKIKQEQIRTEHQYGFRAFIGATYLNPQKQAINPALTQVNQHETIAQEIAVSGRQQDVKRLMTRISSTEHKLIVIHGQSGVGKSSILNAGLIPALQKQAIGERDALPVTPLRVYTDWIGILGQSLADAFEQVKGCKLPVNLDSEAAVIEELRKNADRNLLTVLCFDQFEEFFFVYTDKSHRRQFYEFLRVCLDIPFVKVILSLREDYLHYLLECDRLANFTVTNNNILDKNIRYELGNFSPEDAKVVIEVLNQKTHSHLEPALIDKLVDDLAGESGEVRPIELQIVGMQLQTAKITTLQEYRQFGTKEKLVEQFLEAAIKDCGTPNERAARLVLYLLTDETGTRPQKTRAELAADLAAETDKIDLVLEIFVNSGLVLLLPEVPADRYQLVHDYLVSFIRQQQGFQLLTELRKEQEQRRQAQEQLNYILKWALVVSILAVLGLLWLTGRAESEKQRAEKSQVGQSDALTHQADLLFQQGKEFDALIVSLKAGIPLKRLANVEDDTQLRVEGALQQAIDWLKERDRLEGHSGRVLSVSFSPNGQILASSSADKTIKLWDVATAKEINCFKGHNGYVRSVKFSPDGKTLASGSDDKTIKLWNVFRTKKISILKGHSDKVYRISFSPDSKTLASSSFDRTIKLWNVATAKEIRTFRGHSGKVYGISFSPNGKTLASGSDDKTIKLWDVATGKELRTLKDRSGEIYSVSFSPDGKTLASSSFDNTIKLWDVATGKAIRSFKGHSDYVTSVSFSPDGKTLASSSFDQSIKLWDIATAKPIQNLEEHSGEVHSVTFSPNGKTLASSSADNTVKLWDVTTGRALHNLDKHSGEVYGVSFSPDGKTLASSSADNTVKLWNVTTGKEIRTLKGHSNYVMSVSFSPDGKTLASGSFDRIVILQKDWNQNLNELVVRGCKLARNYLHYNPKESKSRNLCDD